MRDGNVEELPAPFCGVFDRSVLNSELLVRHASVGQSGIEINIYEYIAIVRPVLGPAGARAELDDVRPGSSWDLQPHVI